MKFNLTKYFPSETTIRKPSIIFLLFTICFAFWFLDFWKPYNMAKKETNFHWDVFGYYSFLPAEFCNGGSFKFPGKTPSGYNPVGPLGTFVPKCTYGMSIMYAPFFALGYKIAYNQQSPLDGFSEPFATCIHWGSIFYVILGLYFLRKLLLFYFNEVVTTITLFATLFGTMLFIYTYSNNPLTHGYLFCLFSIFLYLTYRWHQTPNLKFALVIAFIIGLISLIRPTEIIIFLFFIFWNVKNFSDFGIKIKLFLKHYLHFVLIFMIGLLMWIPQFIFWKNHTGTYFYFSYPGERFFWSDPQIINILFSYRKGWLVYTPMILLSFIGIFFIKKDFPIAKGVFVFIISLTIYILSCWWDWFFGGCFGARGFCQDIAYLAFPLAFLVDFLLYSPKKFALKGLLSLIMMGYILSCVCLNIGQTYQYLNFRIHPYSMSEKVYWEVFRTFKYRDEYQYEYWGGLKEPNYEKLRSGEDRDQ